MIIGLGTDMELYRHRARVTMRERFDASVSAKSQTDTMNYVNRVGTSTSYVSYIGNLVATRISSLWGFTGPAFTITEGGNSVYRCLDVARDMLLKGDIDAAVIGGVDLCGSAESLYLKTRRSKMSTNQEPTISFDQSNDGFFVGEGCGALVLRRLEECDPNSSPQIYCTIDGVGCSTSVATAANTAVQQAHITTNEIDYVEISADGEDQLDTAELIGLSTSMSNNNASVKSIAVGCAKATVGHTGYASGAASLIKTALCLHNRFLPELPSWSGPKQKHARTWNNSNFYICPDSRAWVKNDAEHRHASVSGVAQDGQSCYNVVMSDVQGTHEDQNKMSLDDKVSKLIIIRGNTIEQLKQRVVQLRADCSAENNDVKGECPLTYHQLIKATVELEQTSSSTNNALTLCVVTTAMKLQRELKSAERGLEKCQNSNNNKTEWTSPSGSYFTTEPIRSDRIAFVYGDGASPYYGLGRDLNRLVPSLHEIVNEKTTEMWSVGDEAWNTRQVDKSKMEQYANDFSSQTVDLFRSGVYHSVCHTSIARDILGIAPKCAFGLSMGEVAMLFAFSNANSKQSDEMTRRLNSSKVWTQELAVEFNALRREWNVDAKADVSEFWQGYVVHASRTQVEQCVRQLRVQHVRLVIVNDDKTCIIAGFPQECEQLISTLNIKAGKIDQSMVGHYPEVVGPLKKDVAQIHNMLSMPSGPLVQGVELLTCVGNVPYTNMKHRTIHENIGALYSEIADFQQITETAYSKGYDVFIELGAGDLRSAAIGSILKGRKHLAVSIDRKNIDPWSQMMRMLAKLISHGVQANVSKLYHKDMLQTPKKKSRLRRDIELNAHYVSVGKVKKDASSGASTSTSVNSSSSNGLKLVPGAPRHQIIETLMDANGTITAPKAVVYDEPEYEWNPDLRDSEGNQLYTIENDIAYQYKRQKEYKGPIIWNYDDLLQYAEGDIEPVFGPDYAILDTYQKRVRLPKREYLLCSRVCSMTCKTKCFEKCSMITEYDLPINGELSEGGDVPWAVLVESGQCDLMLCSYVGVDFQCKGERAYRLLDTTLKFFGVAQEGQTLNYDIKINGYANRPDGSGECSMFFFEYNCYVDGKLLIEMRNGVAGFFNEAELAAGKGVVHTPRELKKRAEIKKEDCTPYLINPSKKLSYSEADMQHLSVHGRNKGWGSVMPSAAGVNYKLCARKMLMIDRVTSVDPTGGAHGLGLIIGEKILERDAWFFPCHFHKDQVMAGSLVADGCSQMLKLYMIWLGLHHTVDELVFRPVPGIGNKVRCRGAIGPQKGKLVYVMEITEMGYDKKTGYPFARALVNILNINFEKGQTFNMSDLHQYGLGEDSDKRIVVDFQNIALRIEGKPTNFHPRHGGKKVSSIPRAVRSAPQTAMVNRPQPPSKFMFHGGPKLGKETLMTWHPLAGIDGNPTPGFQPTAYPPRAVAFVPFPGNPNDYNHEAGVLPLGWFNLMEFTANRTSLCLGKEFARFDGSNTSRMPAFDLQLVTRVLTVEGMDMTPMYGIDRNPSKGIMTAEFDCPADAWFFQGSSSANHMPYSIIMEIALQVSGVLTSWLKAPLCLDRDDLLFRNLDAKVTLVKDLDLRGKTIKNVTTAKSYSMLGTMGVHSFHAELSVDGEVFYIVDTSFGWFLPEVFEKQTGMDQGKTRDCWHLKEGANDTRNMQTYNLRSTSDVSRMFAGMENQQVQRRSDQVNFVDEVNILSNGGKHGKGYVSGNKIVNKQDWFFSCHFWCDPVMPGSLGIESMFECIEYWAVTQGWTKGFKCASFAHGAGETSWKYRGQLTPRNDRMDNEVHIKTVTKNRDGSIDIVADGGLYVDHLRVYDAVSLRVRIEEASTPSIAVNNARPAPQISRSNTAAASTAAMVNRPQPPSKFMFHGGPKLGKETLMTWHPLAGIDGNPTPGFQPTAYPPRAVAFVPFPGNPNDYNHEAGVLPLGWFNLMEFTANRTSLCLGKEFARFDGSNTSRMPAFDLQLVTRVLTVEGMDMTPMYGIDRNPSKGIMTAEFDCPADAWFFQGSSSANHMPYSIIMEIALQVSGVLTSWLKAPLCLDRDDLLFRNLDAKVTLVKDLDLRGKTIKNVTTAKSYSMLGTMGVHSFHAELSVDGEVFYIVDTSFGWFLPEVFEKQTGMDQGKTRDCWHLKEGANDTRNMQTYNLRSTSDVSRMFAGMENQQVQRRSDQVNFVDEVNILSNGGKHGKGYVSGNKIVNKQDWFFSCHFWCDPVMPGSLGIESMFECIEYWAVTQGWTKGFKCASFAHGAGETSWKYRGQLTPRNDRMDNEVHIKTVTKNRDGSIDIVADGGLYVDHLRVYDAVSLRVRIEEATVVAPQRRAVVPTPTRRGEQKTSSGGRVLTVRKSNMLLTPQSPSASGLSTPMMVPVQSMSEDEALAVVRQRLLQTNETFHAHVSPTGELCGVTDDRAYGSIEIKACTYANLGDPSFLKAYNCTLPLYTGAMAKGIASAELVVAAGKEGVLASLGAGGLPLGLVDKALDHIQTHLNNNEPYAVNLIHSPFDDHLEKGCVDLLLKRGVRIVEASAFMALTPHVVRYRVAGLRKDPTTGKIICDNKIIFKVSRTELAEMALRPAPKKLLKKLLKAGEITKEQAEMSKYVPMCDDIAVEADSGGHTDNRPIHVILPLIMRLRDRITKELKYGKDRRVRVGVGGGIGCPEAALAAFSMGAAFVVTGTINQMCRQAGTCDYVRKVLSEATYSDVTMAPAADMFDQGVELQVIKKGTLFASRARKLFQLFQSYDSLDEIPKNEMKKIEKRIFQKSCDDVWEETRNFYINRLKDPEKVKRAEEKDPKLKMSMTFRWYLSKSSGWANRGGPDRQGKNRQLDYQIWCGPAIGSFNEFIKGTYLDPKVANAYPDVVQINKQVLFGACYLRRLQSLTRAHEVTTDLGDLPTYVPGEPL